jgi:alpha-galactosidase
METVLPTDTARRWKEVLGNAMELFGRNWQNNSLWINDPDVIVLEKLDLNNDDTGELELLTLTDDEFEFHKACIVASGGMILSGDPLPTMPENHLNVLRKLLPPIGVAARFDDASYSIGRINLEDRQLLCIFNKDDKAKEVEVSLNGDYRIYDFWTEEELGVFSNKLKLQNMAPHFARVLVCVKPV